MFDYGCTITELGAVLCCEARRASDNCDIERSIDVMERARDAECCGEITFDEFREICDILADMMCFVG